MYCLLGKDFAFCEGALIISTNCNIHYDYMLNGYDNVNILSGAAVYGSRMATLQSLQLS